MDGKLGTFLLGVIAAVVLVMLWRHEKQQCTSRNVQPGAPGPGVMPSVETGGCCGAGSSSPSYAAGPATQGDLELVGLGGAVSPGAPPLGASTGTGRATSYYAQSGPTSDTSFTFTPTPPRVPGSNTTPAAGTPARALANPAPSIYRYNIIGIPEAGEYIQ